MENKANFNSEELSIQNILGNYLKASTSGQTLSSDHLDEDSLSAFVDGNLGKSDAQPIVSHLVDCSFCRNVTSELIKLEFAFAESPSVDVVKDAAPSMISQVLSNVLSRIFGTNDGAVFAHHESEEDENSENEDAEDVDLK